MCSSSFNYNRDHNNRIYELLIEKLKKLLKNNVVNLKNRYIKRTYITILFLSKCNIYTNKHHCFSLRDNNSFKIV